jgi:exopolysaccharide production protein ExoZ
MSGRTHSTRLVEIQVLRALAVLLVVFAHIHQYEARLFDTPLLADFAYFGFGGVELFFVISGFIIHRVFGTNKAVSGAFFLNRANRIYPLYWLFTGAAVVGYLSMGDSLTRSIDDLDYISSLTLAPTRPPPILVVGWTLTHELYFYLAFGLYTLLPAPIRPWSIGAWAGATLVSAAFLPTSTSPWILLLVSPFNFLFLGGAALSKFSNWFDRRRNTAIIVASIGLILGLWWTHRFGLAGLNEPTIRVAVMAPFAIGCVWAALSWKPALPPILARIGDWSYAIYLSHILVIGVLVRVLAGYLEGGVGSGLVIYSLCLLACLLTGWVTHIAVERPLLGAGKTAIRRILGRPG